MAKAGDIINGTLDTLELFKVTLNGKNITSTLQTLLLYMTSAHYHLGHSIKSSCQEDLMML